MTKTTDKCECLDRGHDCGDGVHCLCGGVLPRASYTVSVGSTVVAVATHHDLTKES